MRKSAVGKIVLILAIVVAGWGWGRSRLGVPYKQAVYRFGNEALEMIIFDPKEKSAVRVLFDNDIWMPTADGRGEWRIGLLSRLAEKNGKSWLESSLGEKLANGRVVGYTDLGMVDKLRIWRAASAVDSKTIEGKFWEEKVAADGQKMKILSNRWNKKKKEIFWDSGIAKNGSYVIVENASGLPGVGNFAAESIDISGGRVFDVVKSDEILPDSCQLAANSQVLKSELAGWLKDRFDCKTKKIDGDGVIVRVGRRFGEKIIGLL